jgi:hypothetical protein
VVLCCNPPANEQKQKQNRWKPANRQGHQETRKSGAADTILNKAFQLKGLLFPKKFVGIFPKIKRQNFWL